MINAYSISAILVCLLIFHKVLLSKKDNGFTVTLSDKASWILFIVLFSISIILRFIYINEIPGIINQDSAMAAVNAKSIMQTGCDIDGVRFPMHFNAWNFSQMNALPSYLLVPFFYLGGMNMFTLFLCIFLYSITGMLFVFLFTKKAFGNTVAILFMLFCLSNPWHFMQSRWFLEASFFAHFFAIGVYFLYIGFIDHKKWCIYLAIIVFAISHYTYGVSLYTVPLLLITLYIIGFKKKYISGKTFIISVLLYLFISLPFYLMIFINMFDLSSINYFGITIPFFPNSVRAQDIVFFTEHPIKQFAKNIGYLLTTVLSVQFETIWTTIPNIGTLMLFTIPLYLTGIFLSIKKIKNTFDMKYVFIFAWLGVSIINGCITNKSNSNRLNIIMYPLMILMAIGTYYIINNSKFRFISLFLIYLVCSSAFLKTYYTEYDSYLHNADYTFTGKFYDALNKAKELNSTYYVITPDSQHKNAFEVTEVYTRFVFDIDSDYANGDTLSSDSLSYSEKYCYRNVTNEDILHPQKDITYLADSNHISMFDANEWTIYDYYPFYVCQIKN